MSIKIMSMIWDSGPEKQAERFVLLALADFANDSGECWPSIDGIAKKTCLTPRGVQKILRALEADGWISTVVGGGRKGCNQYRIATTPPNVVHPERGSPRTTFTTPPNVVPENPERGSPEPSGTITEPSISAQAAPTRVHRFVEFWESYPHRNGAKKGKQPALERYRRAVKAGVAEAAIIEGALAAHRHPDVVRGFARDPATWLNQRGWEDEVVAPPPGKFGKLRGRYEA